MRQRKTRSDQHFGLASPQQGEHCGQAFIFSQPCGYAVGDHVFPSMSDLYSWPSNVTVSPVWYASCAPVGCTHSGAPEPSSTTSRHAGGGCHTFAGVNDTHVFPSCCTVQSFG